MRYGAFLSYSHIDEAVARWLLRRLERYRVPSHLVGTTGRFGQVPARIGPVFRDRDELPTGGDLGNTITAALNDSGFLVVLCSPVSAQSRWVNAEIAAFRSSGRTDRILCFIVDGDPTGSDPSRACFPPALLAADIEGAPLREPVAADARREGDGRERAFVRLVAGLLGVTYDALARRETHRRQRRLAVMIATSVVITSVSVALAIAAYAGRSDAQRRQAQAEDILGFMLGDLRTKLTTVGRLDLMRNVDDKATAYFATLEPRDLSERALEEQARSLTGIGQVRLAEGNHDAALAAFREAHSRSKMLFEREPANGQRLFDLAQAEFWIGFVALEQGRHAQASEWLRKYRDSGIRLAAMDHGNFEWQKELAYGQQNLAVMNEKFGHYAEAERGMLAVLDLFHGWLIDRPRDFQLRFEATDAVSWLGSLALQQGRLAEAEARFVEQTEAVRHIIAEEPQNANWQEAEVEALLLLAEAQTERGRVADASGNVEKAAASALALAARDAANNFWRLQVGRCRYWQAQLGMLEQPAVAAAFAADAAAQFGAAYAAEPRSVLLRRWLVNTRNLQARLALGRDDIAAARAHSDAAYALIEPAWRETPSEKLRLHLARTRILQGEIAQRAGDAATAAAAWSEAYELLRNDAVPELPFERLDPLVRALRNLGAESEAAPHLRRLERAGYVPLQPFPSSGVSQSSEIAHTTDETLNSSSSVRIN